MSTPSGDRRRPNRNSRPRQTFKISAEEAERLRNQPSLTRAEFERIKREVDKRLNHPDLAPEPLLAPQNPPDPQ